jgi:hypothetical protein
MREHLRGDFGNSLFVCSKPIQFLNCAAIAKHYKIKDANIIVVTKGISDLIDFKRFIGGLYEGVVFERVDYVKTHKEAVSLHHGSRYKSLFIEDDRVSLYYILDKIRRKNTIVFEEGFGTYLGSYKYSLSGIRYFRWLWSSLLFGCGLDFGEGRKTNHVMVRYPDLFKAIKPHLTHKVLPMPGHVSECNSASSAIIDLYESDINFLLDAVKEKCIAVVLGKWGGIENNDKKSIKDNGFDLIFYKPHPHDGAPETEFAALPTPSWFPAELLITIIARTAAWLTVYHYGSSVFLYKKDLPVNVTYRCLSSGERYDKLVEHIEAARGIDKDLM